MVTPGCMHTVKKETTSRLKDTDEGNPRNTCMICLKYIGTAAVKGDSSFDLYFMPYS